MNLSDVTTKISSSLPDDHPFVQRTAEMIKLFTVAATSILLDRGVRDGVVTGDGFFRPDPSGVGLLTITLKWKNLQVVLESRTDLQDKAERNRVWIEQLRNFADACAEQSHNHS